MEENIIAPQKKERQKKNQDFAFKEREKNPTTAKLKRKKREHLSHEIFYSGWRGCWLFLSRKFSHFQTRLPQLFYDYEDT